MFLCVHRRTVTEEFFRHEQRSGETRRWAPKRGRTLVLHRVRGLSVLAVLTVVVFVEVVVLFPRMLHMRLGRGASGCAANAGAAASVGGSGLSSGPIVCAPAGASCVSVRHRAEVVEGWRRASAPYLARQLLERDSR